MNWRCRIGLHRWKVYKTDFPNIYIEEKECVMCGKREVEA